jgi:hypothetical protein
MTRKPQIQHKKSVLRKMGIVLGLVNDELKFGIPEYADSI